MDQSVYSERRARVRASMGSGLFLAFAAPAFIRNGDVEHEYRQDSNFHYLTGLGEPECALLIVGGAEPKTILFLRERDKDREIWDGPRAGLEGATRVYQADEAYPIGELAKRLPELLGPHDTLYYRFGVRDAHDALVLDALRAARKLRRARGGPTHLVDSATILNAMRWKKTPLELAQMRRAIAITGEAHRAAMAVAAPGRFEYELEAELRRVFRRAGSERTAYTPIVGSGPNATVLHHILNDRQLGAGELVLIDAGCEVDCMAADVTRTFPVSGTFSPEQRQIYEIVLGAQRAAFAVIRPGATLEQIHQASLEFITQGLIELGFIEGPLAEALKEERYKPFFMHRTGHYLGLDVHDVAPRPPQGEPLRLEPGVVITVEPGIYIQADETRVPERYRGIGIRVEDDALVTESGFENLSEGIPTSVQEIEALMAERDPGSERRRVAGAE